MVSWIYLMEGDSVQQIHQKKPNLKFSWEKVLKSRFMEVVHKAEIVWREKFWAELPASRQCSLSSTQLHNVIT